MNSFYRLRNGFRQPRPVFVINKPMLLALGASALFWISVGGLVVYFWR
jgi:hypothetical protein